MNDAENSPLESRCARSGGAGLPFATSYGENADIPMPLLIPCVLCCCTSSVVVSPVSILCQCASASSRAAFSSGDKNERSGSSKFRPYQSPHPGHVGQNLSHPSHAIAFAVCEDRTGLVDTTRRQNSERLIIVLQSHSKLRQIILALNLLRAPGFELRAAGERSELQ